MTDTADRQPRRRNFFLLTLAVSVNKHAAWSVSEILMPCNDLHKGPYTIRRAANLVIRVKVLGFLQALHNEPEPDVSFYMCRVLDYCIYGTLRTQRWGFDVALFVRVVS